jgi:tetratricopeptide (TPR) repeat protein/membrane protein YqaA with SNARE-associated domain
VRTWVALSLLIAFASLAHAQGGRRDGGFIGKEAPVLEIDDCPAQQQVSQKELDDIGREHFDRGAVLYEQGDYKGAVKEFVAAYCIRPYFTILKDIGQSYERELDFERALAYLERYVMTIPKDAPRMGPCGNIDPQADKNTVIQRIKVLQGLRAKIRINTDPPDAQITLSNESGLQNRGRSGQEMEVTGGRYDVLIEAKGYVSVVQEVRAEIGKPYTLFTRMVAKKGKLRVRTVPSNARLFLDQKQVGIGAFENELEGRKYVLSAEAPDFVTATREIEVIADRDTPITLELVPQPQTGRRQFIAYGTVAGSVAGGTLAGATAEPAVIAVGAMVGLGAGFFGSYFITPRDIPLGTSSLTITSSLIGGVLGGTVPLLFTDDAARVAPAIGSGLVLGGLTGYYLGQRIGISPGDAAVINSGALWGTVVGSLFSGSFEATSERRIGASLVLTGLGMGTLGGVLMTNYFNVSRTRAALIDLGGVVGVFVGAAIDNVVTQSSSGGEQNAEQTANYTLGGLATGLVLAGILTRNMDTPKVSVTPVMSVTQPGSTTASTPTFGVGGQF